MAEQRKKDLPTERRAWVRIPSSHEVTCRSMSASAVGQPGRLRNVSRGGLAILLSRFFAPGHLLTIELPKKTRRGSRSFPVQVVHTAREGERHWILGCMFIYPYRKDELLALVTE